MQEQRIPDPRVEDAAVDAAVLGLLLYGDDQLPWSLEEIDRAIGSDTTDSLRRLYASGLIHRLDRFAWPTRAAVMGQAIRL